MSNSEFLRQSTVEATNRMSNLGMTVKTAGVTLFGAGVVNFLSIADEEWLFNFRLTYCLILFMLGFTFVFLDASYLRRERAFREIQKLLLQNSWKFDYLDVNFVFKNGSDFPEVRRFNCFLSASIFPILLFEIVTTFSLFFFI